MAITNFIPTVWSENLYTALDKTYIGVANCNRDYEGEIRNQGSVVKICGVGEIDVKDYTKDTDMSTPQTLSDTVRELVIDQAKYFNFQIDDIDKAQCTPKLMDAAMKIAADGLASAADKYVFRLCREKAQIQIENSTFTADNILDIIIDARRALYDKNVSDQCEVVLEITPLIASMLMKAKINLATDNTAVMENGYLGNLAGCKVFVSSALPFDKDGVYENSICFMRTKRAVAFAEQLSEIDAYRPEKRFADAVKGLHLYGASVVYPEEVVCMDLKYEF